MTKNSTMIAVKSKNTHPLTPSAREGEIMLSLGADRLPRKC
ncbi:hypothetical protein [Helicobacter sp. T3_23-1056]